VFVPGSTSTSLSWQGSLLAVGDPACDEVFGGLVHHRLDETSWVEHVPMWLQGADHVLAELVERLPLQQRRVLMYDRMVDEPRLTWWWSASAGLPEPLPVLAAMRSALSARYRKPFDSIGCNLYRDGTDSVAWHRDRVGRLAPEPVIAIVSVGEPRAFLVRPWKRHGRSVRFDLGQGDLLVMGGRCQQDWEHTVPKVARAGPRMSITYRHHTEELEHWLRGTRPRQAVQPAS
jgi:alkylated DNA repair dioxygenase AlkB